MIPATTFLPAATRRLVGLCPMLHVVWPSDSTRVCLTIPVPPPPPPKRLPEAQLCIGFTRLTCDAWTQVPRVSRLARGSPCTWSHEQKACSPRCRLADKPSHSTSCGDGRGWQVVVCALQHHMSSSRTGGARLGRAITGFSTFV